MKEQFRQLLTTVDVLNTLNGGVSEPYLSYTDLTDGRELRIRVPGVSKEMLLVEIHNNILSVSYHIPMEASGKTIYFPREVIRQPLPYYVEIPGIQATYEDSELVVKLPFNELSNGYSRKVPIED